MKNWPECSSSFFSCISLNRTKINSSSFFANQQVEGIATKRSV